VAEAYANGETIVQFRLAFPNAPASDATDEVRFIDPRLSVSTQPR
jgi:hypothetical protein